MPGLPMPEGSTVIAVATGFSGILAGCLTFGSFVDTRAINLLVEAGEESVIKKFFPYWWPCGRDLMVPLLLLTTTAHALAFAVTREMSWLLTGAASLSIGPYTAIVLGEDIAKLRSAETKEVANIARSFCRLHHPRTVIAGTVLMIALRAGAGRK